MAGKLTCVNIETTQASSVVTPSIKGQGADWVDNNSGRYKKYPDGSVEIQVTNNTTSPGQTMLTLPSGFRPGRTLTWSSTAVDGSNVLAFIDDTTGVVSVYDNGVDTQPPPPGAVIRFFAEK